VSSSLQLIINSEKIMIKSLFFISQKKRFVEFTNLF
jgi:hypothetical protein